MKPQVLVEEGEDPQGRAGEVRGDARELFAARVLLGKSCELLGRGLGQPPDLLDGVEVLPEAVPVDLLETRGGGRELAELLDAVDGKVGLGAADLAVEVWDQDERGRGRPESEGRGVEQPSDEAGLDAVHGLPR